MYNKNLIISNFKEKFDSLTQEQKLEYLDHYGFKYTVIDQEAPSAKQNEEHGIRFEIKMSNGRRIRQPHIQYKSTTKKQVAVKKAAKDS